MSRDTTVIAFRQPDNINDPLTELAREGARRMLAQVLVAEADAFVAMWKDLKLPDGRDRIVRHGHGPDRTIQTGVGPVEVRRAKVRDRHVGREAKIRFSSSILPKWARRTKSLDALLPVLYLRGVSTGDFQEALTALLGIDAPNLSPAVISRLTAQWQADYDTWQKRDLSARRYVYVWADGVYLQARMEDNAECMLVLIGATPEGKKELVGFQTGVRESAQSWRELLIDIKQRGLEIAPDLAIGDGALGFWKAIEEVFPSTRHQRCWVHKTANVLNKVALSVQVNMKVDLREIYGAPTRAAAEAAIDVFADKYGAKYDKAVACLTKDREALLAFFDFPAEHWDHLRTSNPIESVFATVRHRTVRTKGALSAKTAKFMVFKLVNAAAKTWRRLKGENQLPKVVQGVKPVVEKVGGGVACRLEGITLRGKVCHGVVSVPALQRRMSAVPRRREQGHCEPGLAQDQKRLGLLERALAGGGADRAAHPRRHCRSRPARSQGHVDLAASGHWRVRGRPEVAARGQEHGWRIRRSLALRSRRSDRARPAAAGLSHRRWRAGLGESDRRRLGWRAGAAVHGS
jgi:putative transposase